ncbi:unnamed protein product (macronuclear) [Paramecium tetraurelia]|uniref:Protein kinase domain-containing protein n=1 Tax=Paramecium tetraurelia TaxID=5888 RepID=A0DSD6_PARTE|nr:uncharacterized protein GSPATT00019657001 [Paramecium tetraurelia]CAK85953.1 unnamed protein product [Paramecium tetraurelia]|eukprot:XP_001453350.1 hypothetical protein (macronuclear) [Paramecium tetraurelia strain d4-2]
MMLSFVYKVEDLNQCQLKQVETLIENLETIKSENYIFFPQSLIIQKQQNQYEFTFTEENLSALTQVGKDTLQIQDQPIYLSKHLLKLFNRLSQLKIYIPTLSQESFMPLYEALETSLKANQNRYIYIQRCLLYNFGLDKLDQNSSGIANNHCLPPELIYQIKKESKTIKFDEKMAIFNLGCILFEMFTKQKMYERTNSFEEQGKYNLTKYIFKPGYKYLNFLFGQLVQKCTLEEETESNKRFTIKEALSQILYIQQCEQYIKSAEKEQQIIKIDDFFSQTSSLHNRLVEGLQIKGNHQLTGRIYILQNLMRMKFVFLLFQKEELECFRDFLIMKLIVQELQGIKELEKHSENQSHILNFKDSVDEITEFYTLYSSKYEKLLFQLILGIEKKVYLEKQRKHFKQQFRSSKVQDFQKNFHADLFQEKTPSQQLLKLCLQNLNTIFLKDQLLLNFRPISKQLMDGNPYEIYDTLLKILFGNEIQQNKIQELIQTINF